MKSKEIQTLAPTDLSTNGWLKLVALQLSILIEAVATETPKVEQLPQVQEKRGPGRPRKVA